MGVLTVLTFLPLLGALLIGCVPAEFVKPIRAIAVLASVATLVVALLAYFQFQSGDYHFQLIESAKWIPSLGVRYLIGIDGVSLWMVVLTALLGVLATCASVYEERRVKAFMALLLLLETTMLGSFVALDMILFFTFFEAALFPIAFMIWIWGDEGRARAAMRVFIYLFAGSILLLVGMVAVANLNAAASGKLTFSLIEIQAAAANGSLWTGAGALEPVIFWAFALAFLIKCPVFPFHTWLVDSYAQSPIGAVLLGALVKTGTYGLLRFCIPLFPDVLPSAAPWIEGLATASILYGAVVACMQLDLKRLIAYSSLSHVGFIVLGIFSLSYDGMLGGVLGGLNHGIATGAMFLLVGFLYLRRRSRSLADFGGLKRQMPVFAALFLVALLAALGLPGTNAFVGEFLALLGTFESGMSRAFGLGPTYAVLAAGGVVLAAVYLLPFFQRLFYGPAEKPAIRRLRDLKGWEAALAALPILFILWGGWYPSTFTKPIEASVNATRMMGVNDPTRRPAWRDPDARFDAELNYWTAPYGEQIEVAKAGLHPPRQGFSHQDESER